MTADITLKKLSSKANSGSEFARIYQILLSDNKSELNDYDVYILLKLAVIFLNQKELNVKKLGYSIILHYSNLYNDYIPLYECSINLGFIPISKFIESKYFVESETNSFMSTWLSAYKDNFKQKNIYLTYEQKKLHSFVNNKDNKNFLIVAPTSYGKSELMVSSILNSCALKTCIIVPTKALLAQTKKRVLASQMGASEYVKIITHPDMYNNDKNFIAILTQERFLTIIQKNTDFYVDRLMIDEAHNMLEKDNRSVLLSQVLLLASKRNPLMNVEYFSPFVEDPNCLNLKYSDKKLKAKKITEFLKIERYFIYNKGKLKQYDQFNDVFFNEITIGKNEFDFIKNFRSNKNIIYANRPRHVEAIAKSLNTENIKATISETKEFKAIRSFLDKDYNLLDCLQKGIVYHHGSMPDNIKLYVENIYRKYPEINYIATTSTLLEGVNIPAETMFILSSKKGPRNLTRSNFINLIGRVCRFSEIFNNECGNLKLLEPKIYLVNSQFMATNFNPEKFLTDRIKLNKTNKDLIENPLLKGTPTTEETIKQVEYIENIENGTINHNQEIHYATSEIAHLCFINNIQEFDIIKNEEALIRNYEKIKNIEKINDPKILIDTIYELFINNISNINDNNILRLQNDSARAFYKMIIDWRVNGSIYGIMIGSFVRYWEGLKGNDNIVYVGSAWGDIKRNFDDRIELYVDISKKSHKEKVNLAIVKTKEEQDYIDFYVMKYVEIINDLGLLNKSFYKKVKYGSSDNKVICMLQNGFSLELASCLKDMKYNELIFFDFTKNEVYINNQTVNAMTKNDENDILIFEAKFHTRNK